MTARTDIEERHRIGWERRHGRRIAETVGLIVANVGAFMVLFQLYKLVRRSFIQRGEAVGFRHAEQIIDWEKALGLYVELDLQRWAIAHEWLIKTFNYYYAYFMWTFYACAIVALVLAPERYRRLRRVFLLSMLLALPWYALYPLAPPRFMTAEGFIDTLRVYGPNYFSESGLVAANRFAAMPSMHIGWSTIGAIMLAVALPRWRLGPILAVAHVTMMVLTVMVTGNHWWLDIVGGWLVVAASFAAARLLPAEFPLPGRTRPPAASPNARRLDRSHH